MIPPRYVAVDVPFVSYDSKLFISQQLCMRKDIIICDFSDETTLRVYEPFAPLIPTPANVQHIQTLFSIAFSPMTEFKLERDSIYKCTIGETHIIMDSQMSRALWGLSLLFACLTFSIFTSLAFQPFITDYHEPAFSLHTAMALLLDIGGFIMSAQKPFLYLSRVCLSGRKRPFHYAQFFYDYSSQC